MCALVPSLPAPRAWRILFLKCWSPGLSFSIHSIFSAAGPVRLRGPWVGLSHVSSCPDLLRGTELQSQWSQCSEHAVQLPRKPHDSSLQSMAHNLVSGMPGFRGTSVSVFVPCAGGRGSYISFPVSSFEMKGWKDIHHGLWVGWSSWSPQPPAPQSLAPGFGE